MSERVALVKENPLCEQRIRHSDLSRGYVHAIIGTTRSYLKRDSPDWNTVLQPFLSTVYGSGVTTR